MISLSYVSVVALTLLWVSENLFIIILARIVTMVASEIKYLAYSTYVIEVVGPDWRALTGNRLLSAILGLNRGSNLDHPRTAGIGLRIIDLNLKSVNQNC